MSMICISEKAYKELTDSLAAEGHEIVLQGPKQAVSEPIDTHPDIYLCKLGASPKSPVFYGREFLLGPKYPQDVLFNAVVTEKFMICCLRKVSAELLVSAKLLYPDITIIHVPQGYTKCNIVVVDDSHFITGDEGIYKAIETYRNSRSEDEPDISCLLISPGYVELPGYKTGFIGGASGRIGREIWFNGDIDTHPDHAEITGYIENCGLSVRCVAGRPLLDIGSIIELGKRYAIYDPGSEE